MTDQILNLKIQVSDNNTLKLVATGVDNVRESVDKTKDSVSRTSQNIVAYNREAVKGFKKQASSMGTLVKLYATIAANTFAVTSAFRALRDASDFDILSKSLEEFSIRSGANLTSLVDTMREVTQGAVDFNTLMKSASLGTSAGLNITTLENLTKAATNASRAMGVDMTDALNRVFRGAVKAEPELLDELGIILRLKVAADKYAASINKTANELTTFEKQQAVANEVIAQAERKFGDISESLPVNELSRSAATIINSVKESLAELANITAPIFKIFADNVILVKSALLLLSATLIKRVLPEGEYFVKGIVEWERSIRSFRRAAVRDLKDISASAKTLGEIDPVRNFVKKIDALRPRFERNGNTMSKGMLAGIEKGLNSPEGLKTFSNAINGLITRARVLADKQQRKLTSSSKITIGGLTESVAFFQKLSREARATSKVVSSSMDDSNKAVRSFVQKSSFLLNTFFSTAKAGALNFVTAFASGLSRGIRLPGIKALSAEFNGLSAPVGIATKAIGLFGRVAGIAGKALFSFIPIIGQAFIIFETLKFAVFALGDAFGLTSEEARNFSDTMEDMTRDINILSKASTKLISDIALLPKGLESSAELSERNVNLLGSQINAISKVAEEYAGLSDAGFSELYDAADRVESITKSITNSKLKDQIAGIISSLKESPTQFSNTIDKVIKALNNELKTQEQLKANYDFLNKSADRYRVLIREAADEYLPKLTKDMELAVELQTQLGAIADRNLDTFQQASLLGIDKGKADLIFEDIANSIKDINAAALGPSGETFVSRFSQDVIDGNVNINELHKSISSLLAELKEERGFLENLFTFNDTEFFTAAAKLLGIAKNNTKELTAEEAKLKGLVKDELDLRQQQLDNTLARIKLTNNLARAEGKLQGIVGAGTRASINATEELFQQRSAIRSAALKDAIALRNRANEVLSKSESTQAKSIARGDIIRTSEFIETSDIALAKDLFDDITNKAKEYQAIIEDISSGVSSSILKEGTLNTLRENILQRINQLGAQRNLTLAEQDSLFNQILSKAEIQRQTIALTNKAIETGNLGLLKSLSSTRDRVKFAESLLELEQKTSLLREKSAKLDAGILVSEELTNINLQINQAQEAIKALTSLGITTTVQLGGEVNSSDINAAAQNRLLKAKEDLAIAEANRRALIEQTAQVEINSLKEATVLTNAKLSSVSKLIGMSEIEFQVEQKRAELGVSELYQNEADAINNITEALNRKLLAEKALANVNDFITQQDALSKEISALEKINSLGFARLLLTNKQLELIKLRARLESQSTGTAEEQAAIDKLIEGTSRLIDQQKLDSTLQTMVDSITAAGDTIEDEFTNSLKRTFQEGVNGFEDFGTTLRKIASDLAADLAAQFIKLSLQIAATGLLGNKSGSSSTGNSLLGIVGSVIGTVASAYLGGGVGAGASLTSSAGTTNGIVTENLNNSIANSGVFDNLNFSTFAKGGVAREPSIIGEAGPEAAVPLPDGRNIPVKLTGSTAGTNNISIVVNVQSDGSSSVEQRQKDDLDGSLQRQNSNKLANAIAAAVKSEIINQQRNGGSLSQYNNSRKF